MPSPLELILDAGNFVGPAAKAYQSEQPVSGTRADILSYMQKVLNGELDADTARVLFQHGGAAAVPMTPRQDQALPVQSHMPAPAPGLGGTANNAIAAYVRPQQFQFQPPPAPAPAAPVAPAGLSGPVPASAPPAGPAAPVAAPQVTPAEGGLGAVPPSPGRDPYVPASARSAPEALGFRAPQVSAAQVSDDMSRYDAAQQKLAGMAPKKQTIPLRMDMTQVKNREYDEVRSLLDSALKAKDTSKMDIELFKATAALEKQKQKDMMRTAWENMSSENKMKMANAQLQQETDEAARNLYQKYVDLQADMTAKSWSANIVRDEQLRGRFIARANALNQAIVEVGKSAWATLPQGQVIIDEARRELQKLQPFLDAWMTAQPGSNAVSYSVAEGVKPEVLAAAPEPAPEAPKPAPKPVPAPKAGPKPTVSASGSSVKTKTKGNPAAAPEQAAGSRSMKDAINAQRAKRGLSPLP